MATTQKVSAVLKKTGTPRGYWSGSGRVAGWGRWIEGAEIKAEVEEHYVCQFCFASTARNEGHRYDANGRPVSTRCSSYSWRRRTTKTGRVLVHWHAGERTPQYDMGAEFDTATHALTAAGLVVTRDDATLYVTDGTAAE